MTYYYRIISHDFVLGFISFSLFTAALLAIIFNFDWLELYGLHGIGIVFLLFFALSLFGATLHAHEESDSDTLDIKLIPGMAIYVRKLGLALGFMIPFFSITYGIRRAVKYVFNRLPEAYDQLGDWISIGLFLALIYGVFQLHFYLEKRSEKNSKKKHRHR